MQVETFWEEDCPDRGPGLSHVHWDKCDPKGVHPGSVPARNHPFAMCCHCGHTAETWAKRELVAEATAFAPLEVEGCGEHEVRVATPLIDDGGMRWPTCGDCGVQKEPKLATGEPIGPLWGKGRGWVSPRMKNRWSEIAYRAMRDTEQDLPPWSPR